MVTERPPVAVIFAFVYPTRFWLSIWIEFDGGAQIVRVANMHNEQCAYCVTE